MIVPILIVILGLIVLYQFRRVLKFATLHVTPHNSYEEKMMNKIDVKHLCIKCGGEMKTGEAVIHFVDHDDVLLSVKPLSLFNIQSAAFPPLSSNPTHIQILERITYYCPKCHLFNFHSEHS